MRVISSNGTICLIGGEVAKEVWIGNAFDLNFLKNFDV